MIVRYWIAFVGVLVLSCHASVSVVEPSTNNVVAQAEGNDQAVGKTISQKNKRRSRLSRRKKHEMSFSFENTDLVKIINEFAAKKEINIILPQAAQAITQKVTFKLPEPVPLDKAESYIYTFLDIAGYTMRQNKDFYVISKIDAQSNRDPLPLFVNVAPELLPDSDQRIRVIYYLRTFKVPDNKNIPDPLTAILKDMLSPTAQAQGSNFEYDQKSNSIIITDKSDLIASAMKIILELDAVGAREMVEVVPIYNHSAEMVKTLLMEMIVSALPQQQKPAAAQQRGETSRYFSAYTRVVADKRTNSLILMGNETALERIKEFIQEVIDVPQDSGKSVVHTYDLQYLDAKPFADILRKIVTPKTETGQATKGGPGGSEKMFEGVVISAETVTPKKATSVAVTDSSLKSVKVEDNTIGGNRLIIAAKEQDWLRIKRLIQQLDEPEPQAIVEVLVADLSYTTDKILAGQFRNPTVLQRDGGLTPEGNMYAGGQFQSANATAPILERNANNQVISVAPDLLELLGTGNNRQSVASSILSAGSNAGSLIVSFNDPSGSGIFSLLQILSKYAQTKVLQHPFLVVQNNHMGEEVLNTILRGVGDATEGQGGTAIAKIVDITAKLEVAVVPRISSADRLNLQLKVVIQEFTSAATGERVSRIIETNVNMSSGQVLVLGGLSRIIETDSVTETPILGKIPIIGWLFRKSQRQIRKNNLAVFISPTIVMPRIRDGQHEYTGNKIYRAYDELSQSVIFDNKRDPISRYFFLGSGDRNEEFLDEYIAEPKDIGLTKAALKAKKMYHQQENRRPKNKRVEEEKRKKTNEKMKIKKLKELLAEDESPLIKGRKPPLKGGSQSIKDDCICTNAQSV